MTEADGKDIVSALITTVKMPSHTAMLTLEIMKNKGWSSKLATRAIFKFAEIEDQKLTDIPPARILKYQYVDFYDYNFLMSRYGNTSGYIAVKIEGRKNIVHDKEKPYWIRQDDFVGVGMKYWQDYLNEVKNEKI